MVEEKCNPFLGYTFGMSIVSKFRGHQPFCNCSFQEMVNAEKEFYLIYLFHYDVQYEFKFIMCIIHNNSKVNK